MTMTVNDVIFVNDIKIVNGGIIVIDIIAVNDVKKKGNFIIAI